MDQISYIILSYDMIRAFLGRISTSLSKRMTIKLVSYNYLAYKNRVIKYKVSPEIIYKRGIQSNKENI
jgi:hypothetical protein